MVLVEALVALDVLAHTSSYFSVIRTQKVLFPKDMVQVSPRVFQLTTKLYFSNFPL